MSLQEFMANYPEIWGISYGILGSIIGCVIGIVLGYLFIRAAFEPWYDGLAKGILLGIVFALAFFAVGYMYEEYWKTENVPMYAETLPNKEIQVIDYSINDGVVKAVIEGGKVLTFTSVESGNKTIALVKDLSSLEKYHVDKYYPVKLIIKKKE